MHYIHAQQLNDTNIINVIASSSAEVKRLESVIRVIASRFTYNTFLSFRVMHHNQCINVSDKLSLAIKAYNRIQVNDKYSESDIVKAEKALCESCIERSRCKACNKNIRACANWSLKQ